MTFIVGVAILVGLVGVLVPVLPGALLVLAAILVWAIERDGTTGWVVLAVAAALIGVTQVVKYLVPGRRLRDAGIPGRSLVVGGLLGIIGFFVIPVVGLFLGFPVGVYAAERQRLGDHGRAWSATRLALGAVGLSILIELGGALMAAGTWLIAVLAT